MNGPARQHPLDDCSAGQRMPVIRRQLRTPLAAEVELRRSTQNNYRVSVFDASCFGCRLEFIERPRLDERVWVKFDGVESIEALVRWVGGFVAGVEFVRPFHPAVFDQLVARLSDKL